MKSKVFTYFQKNLKLLLTPKNMHACFLPYFAKMCLISRKNCAIRLSHNFSHFSVNLNSNWCCDLFIIIAIIHSKHAISLCRYNSVPPHSLLVAALPPHWFSRLVVAHVWIFLGWCVTLLCFVCWFFRLMMSESFYTDIEQTIHYRKLQ